MSHGNLSNNLPYSGGTSSIFSRLQTTLAQPRTRIIIVCLLLVLSAMLFAYYYVIAPKLKPSYVANNELKPSNNGLADKEAELILFYADWCPHCKTAKPEWNEVKEKYNGKTINGYTILFTEVNCTTETSEIEEKMRQYKIEGFPTIKLLKDGQVVEFDAKPTQSNLNQFLNTVI